MNMQKILFPEVGRCTEETLYFHFRESDANSKDAKEIDVKEWNRTQELRNRERMECFFPEKKIVLHKGAKLWFDTYFNGFSIEKWTKYTVLENLSLEVTLSGRCKVVLLTKEKIHEDTITTVISENIVEAQDPQRFVFPYEGGNKKGMYTFLVEALSENSVFYGGAYTSEIPAEKVREVKIGIGICTFRREPFIEKNLRILNEAILQNPESPMHGHLEVFVADNGQTLDIDRLATDKIHINPNRNLGGAGGFTRDLIEILKNNDKLHITHALLMDDDIVIEPEALVKTYTILSLLKEQYADAFIGGAMLRLDKQYMQVEAGASWNGGYLNSLKKDLDLRVCDSCLYNEVEEYTEFNAWWYCCFPMNVVREDNLPLPIFIRGDDLEYGLRNMKHLILMNGICVWHEPFENKYSSFLEYYITRNQLIDNAFHCPWFGAKHLKRAIWTHCRQEIMFYRYKNIDLYLRGISDFFKGPEWLMAQDGEALHKEIMAAGYKGQDLETLNMPFHYTIYEEYSQLPDTTKARMKRLLTLNGLFLPARGESIVAMASPRSVQFYRKKRVMHYDVTSKKAFITERKFTTSMKYMFKTLGFMFMVPFRIKKAQQAYRTEGLKLRTMEFWKGFLGI